jgi:molybdopterin converting factor small subunit
MPVTLQLTYEMSKALGVPRLELDGPETVADVVRSVEIRFSDAGADFAKLTRVTAIAVNGVLMNYRRGMKTRLGEGDVVAFVKAAAGG